MSLFLMFQKYGDSDVPDDKDSAGSDMMIPASVPVFQSLLLNFLDTKAPVLGKCLCIKYFHLFS